MKKLNKKAVFGLTAVQAFFAIILAIALLAYVIVIIMGTLGTSSILQQASATAVNESHTSADTITLRSTAGASCGTITAISNGTGGGSVPLNNFTQTGCSVVNASTRGIWGTNLLFSYPYTQDSTSKNNLDSITSNVSTGVTSFFSSISPVYAILAVLVIILVLVVLVRVVQAPSGRNTTPQL